MRKILKIVMSVFISICLVMSITSIAWAKVSDVKGHWAEKQINEWVEKGLVKGYSDGTFKPDNPISRAEFCALVNRSFGLVKKANNTFKDVTAKDWFADDISKAAANGYLTGFPDKTAGPDKSITRQEVVTIIARILKLKTNEPAKTKYADDAKLAAWGRGAVAAVSELGYVNTYPDNSFRPDIRASRAEVVYMLSKAVGMLYNTEGIYGPEAGSNEVSGNVTISSRNVTLKNTVIKGNLYLSEGIGEGTITLDKVTVRGTTIILGGGEHGIVLVGSSLGNVINDPGYNKVRIFEKPLVVASAAPVAVAPPSPPASSPSPPPPPPSDPQPPPPPPPAVTVVSADTIDMRVAYGTTLGAITLPTSVVLNLSNTSTCSAMIIKWDTSSYNPNTGGRQRITGTFQLPSGVTNPDNLPAVLNLTVLIGVTPDLIADKIIVKGTPSNDVHLPANVVITLANSTSASALINWNTSTLNTNTLGTYTLTGTLTAAGIEIPENTTVSMRYYVVQPVIDPKPDSPVISDKGTPIEEFENIDSRFIASDGVLELDTRNKISGNASVNISSNVPSGGGSFILDENVDHLDLHEMKNVQFTFYTPDKDQLQHFAIWFVSGDKGHFSRLFAANWKLVNGWNRITVALNDFVETKQNGETPSWGDITQIRLIFYAKGTSKPSVNVDRIAYNVQAKPKVLFTFDNACYDLVDENIPDNAYSYMKSKGFRGTVWADMINSHEPADDGAPKYLNEADLGKLYNEGWDIGNQPQHISNDTQISDQYKQNRQWLLTNQWTRGADFAALPVDVYNDRMVEIMQGEGILAARTSDYGSQSYPVDNIYKLKSIRLNPVDPANPGDTDKGMTRLRDEIKYAIETGSTVILMFYKTGGTDDPPVSITTSAFKEIVDYIDQRRDSIDVVTMSEWYNAYIGANVTGVGQIPDKNDVPLGTTFSAIGLQTQVQVTMNGTRTAYAGINWNPGTYDSNTPGTYPLTGSLVLPAGISNKDNLTAHVNVTVVTGSAIAVTTPAALMVTTGPTQTTTDSAVTTTDSAITTTGPAISTTDSALTITTVSAIGVKHAPSGTTASAVDILPGMVNVVLSDGTTQELKISWIQGPFDTGVPGTYHFTGVLELPEGITNQNDLKVLADIIIDPPVPTP